MANYLAEWIAIADRIEGLLDAGRLFMQLSAHHSSDSCGVVKRELIPHSFEVFDELDQYLQTHSSRLPETVKSTIERFLDRHRKYFNNAMLQQFNNHATELLKLCLPALSSIKSEVSYHLTDSKTVAMRITERAFAHLQRSIIADEDIREKWRRAYDKGEVACEKLGAVHLLQHGIWAFKAHSARERTDLVLGEPLQDMLSVEATAEALVLTEWKKVPDTQYFGSLAEQALRQASLYANSSLYGFELTDYRYLVFVSKERLSMQAKQEYEGRIYKYINIAINPAIPSRS